MGRKGMNGMNGLEREGKGKGKDGLSGMENLFPIPRKHSQQAGSAFPLLCLLALLTNCLAKNSIKTAVDKCQEKSPRI